MPAQRWRGATELCNTRRGNTTGMGAFVAPRTRVSRAVCSLNFVSDQKGTRSSTSNILKPIASAGLPDGPAGVDVRRWGSLLRGKDSLGFGRREA